MAGDITSANAVITIWAPSYLPVPVQLQGFSADDIFSNEDVDTAETYMGVDGVLSGGVVFAKKPQEYMLQADSASNAFFDNINQYQQINLGILTLSGNILFTAIGTTWTMAGGILTRYKPLPDARRVLQPRRYTVTWGQVVPSYVSGAG